MTFYIISLFPEMFEGVFSQSILSRAQKEGQIEIKFINPRDFSGDKYQSVDDKPYGGGAGMIMRADIVISALESISTTNKDRPDIKPKPYSILLAASGKKYNQKTAVSLKTKKQIASAARFTRGWAIICWGRVLPRHATENCGNCSSFTNVYRNCNA
jgi:tRNA (guanine37-N1)-methyltransferase